MITPLMATTFFQPPLPDRRFQAVIFTSETAVQAAKSMGAPLPTKAFCVGDRTAQAARQAGFMPDSAEGDVTALERLILNSKSTGPLLHLRGKDSAGDLAQSLTNCGIETLSAIVYTQDALDLTPEAITVFARQDPVIVPLFSPRSATLLVKALPLDRQAPLGVVAISQNTADAAQALAPDRFTIAAHPDGENMLLAVLEMANWPGKA